MTGPTDAEERSGIPRVIVVGNLTLDDVVQADGTTRMASAGGNCLYAALGARLWEPNVGLVTRRGDDFPAAHLNRLAELGIDTSGVVAIPGPTVRNWVIYEADGRRSWVYRTPRERSREVAVRPGDIPGAWLGAAAPPVVHVAAMPLAAAEAVIGRVRQEAGAPVITLDTHEDWGATYRDRVLALAARADVFAPSRTELAALLGYDDPGRALRELATLPTPVVVVKMGADGCLIGGRGTRTPVRVGVSAGPVIDTTGAGDAFCGGLAAGLARGLGPVEAARRGAVSAGLAIEGFSSMRLAGVTPDEARERLATAAPAVSRRFHGHAEPAVTTPGAHGGRAAGSPGPPGGADRRDIAVMREEIATIPQVISAILAGAGSRADDLAASLVADGVEHLFLTGCGDSYFAGLGTCLVFAKHAGVTAHAMPAMELARYRARYLPPRSAVLCVSYSGKVGRTIEAAAQARKFGHRVVALTGDAAAPLAAAAGDSLLIEVPTHGYAPGTSTYVAMQVALADVALRWAAARGRPSDQPRHALAATAGLSVAALDLAGDALPAVAARLADRPWASFLGAGPAEASARFGAAKLAESAQLPGLPANLEEWAHEHYFCTGKGTPVIVIAPSGASRDRAAEILAELAFIAADAILLSDTPPADPAVTHIPLPATGEEFAPIIAAVPLSLLGFHVAVALGKRSYNFPSPEAEAEHYATIHRAATGVPA